MIKSLLSPLFLCLFILLLFLLYLRGDTGKMWSRQKRARKILNLLVVFVILLWGISTPFFADVIAEYWESPYSGEHRLKIQEENGAIVTVLSGGIYRGFTEEQHIPGDSTIHRVYRGAKIFHDQDINRMILQGRLSNEEPDLMGRLMKNQAVMMNVPSAAVEIEAYSSNTAEHPLRLLNLDGINSESLVVIVTAAWHLRRAEQEFSRHFENVETVPAEFLSQDRPGGVKNFIPSANSLSRSTKILHEIIGIVWYRIKNRAAPLL